MIVPKYFEDLSVLHVNTMPNRAYYIPDEKTNDGVLTNRETSERFQLLNGKWAFKYYPSIHELTEEFYQEGADLSAFGTINVPGVWQCEGYDIHQYTNVKYPIPFDPPYVPRENPCGAYVTKFQYEKKEGASQPYLNFEGVDSCFYVWLNGAFVGYSQVSHSTGEFKVGEYLNEGENTLAVLVLKWCDGTYLEDQDKFRMSGIFRDVYLLHRPEEGIFDYFVKARPDQDYKNGIVDIEFTYFNQQVPVEVSLLDEEGNTVMTKTVEDSQVHMEIGDISLWNAEQPYLYTLVLKTGGETIVDWVGFREIHVENSIVYINGVPIKFHGVNRHDSDPLTGFVISTEQIMTDLRLMKEHNVNGIRTSHYPNAPQFYLLYDRLGFYVIDEADNESHGTEMLFRKPEERKFSQKRWNESIADNPLFTEATIDRTRRCVERDKNRPSVVIWSMGNECAYGCTFEAALEWTKAFDPDRLRHFESARYVSDVRKYDYSNLDLYSRMYPSLQDTEEYCIKDARKPFLMCEFAHAMGNGPGDLEDYFQLIHRYDCMCGGYVWEWCDHAMYRGVELNGKKRYGYGGDFKEYPHDGNFCVDGLVYPDRRPHTGLKEFKNVYRPLRVIGWDQETGTATFHNYMDFVNAKDYVTVKIELVVDGIVTDSHAMEELDLAPQQEKAVVINISSQWKELADQGKAYLRFTYLLKQDTDFRKAGYELGTEEVRLNELENSCVKVWKEESAAENGKICCQEGDRYIELSAPQFRYVYDKFTGTFSELVKDNQTLLERPMEYNIWRAPTDNDMYIKQEWKMAGYDRMMVRTYETEIEAADGEIRIKTGLSMAAPITQKFLEIEVLWTVSGNGDIHAAMDVKRNADFPYLPRFGIRMFLPKEFGKVEYCGMGPYESYIDKHQASVHGVFKADVEKLHEDYIKPQENGSHHGCDYVTLIGKYKTLTAYGETPLAFNASCYTQEELTEKAHNYELEPSPYTVLCLDYQQSGIGSNSCGPALVEKYRFEPSEFTFRFCLRF